MVKHAIVIASEDWCEAASEGRVRIYFFEKPRRKGIRALGPGSVCVVLAKAEKGKPSRFYGEFDVTRVREVGAGEYNKLAEEGFILTSQRLRPGERRWIIEFEEFREYAVKVPKKDVDVKTSTCKKPISEWPITGLTYIDEIALDGIRSKAGGFRSLSHKSLADMISEVGEILGFYVKREESTPDGHFRLDITWRTHPLHSPLKVWEIEVSGKVESALARLKHAFDIWHPELYLVVSDVKTKERAESLVRPKIGAFAEIEKFLTTVGIDEIVNLYNSLKPHREFLSKLARRYS